MDEMIKRFNNFAAEMNIPGEDKMTLLAMITEIGYTHERLLPCPFCSEELEYEEHVCRALRGRPVMRLWAHPSGKCILSGMEVPLEDHPAWNRRAEEA